MNGWSVGGVGGAGPSSYSCGMATSGLWCTVGASASCRGYRPLSTLLHTCCTPAPHLCSDHLLPTAACVNFDSTAEDQLQRLPEGVAPPPAGAGEDEGETTTVCC